VPGLERNAEPQRFDLQFTHEGGHAGGNRAEIVVAELLVLRRHMPHQRPARDHQVGTGGEQFLIHQEIFLLPTQVTLHLVDLRVEEPADGHGGVADSLDGALERGLVVEGLAGVGDEHRWGCRACLPG
jgi:hypothetical protein